MQSVLLGNVGSGLTVGEPVLVAGSPTLLLRRVMVLDRGAGVNLPSQAPQVGLPARVFLFTLDQISVMLDISEVTIRKQYVYYEGRSIGSRRRDLMVARNIAPADESPEWRIAEREFVRWMKQKGFRYYERGAVAN